MTSTQRASRRIVLHHSVIYFTILDTMLNCNALHCIDRRWSGQRVRSVIIVIKHSSHCTAVNCARNTNLDDRGRGREQAWVPEVVYPHGRAHDDQLEGLDGLCVLGPVLYGDLGPSSGFCDGLGAAEREGSEVRRQRQRVTEKGESDC